MRFSRHIPMRLWTIFVFFAKVQAFGDQGVFFEKKDPLEPQKTFGKILGLNFKRFCSK
jgi:hypothetical protein